MAAGLHADGIGSLLTPKSHGVPGAIGGARPVRTLHGCPKAWVLLARSSTQPRSSSPISGVRGMRIPPHILQGHPGRARSNETASPNRCTGRVGHVTWKLFFFFLSFFLSFVLVLVHAFPDSPPRLGAPEALRDNCNACVEDTGGKL